MTNIQEGGMGEYMCIRRRTWFVFSMPEMPGAPDNLQCPTTFFCDPPFLWMNTAASAKVTGSSWTPCNS